jgi:hypothetical protein
MQTTSNLLMIRPVAFGFNAETAVNNSFQKVSDATDIQQKAIKEFNDFVLKLIAAQLNVTVIDDTLIPHTPDSIFPNNWISFDSNGSVCLYPMFAINRRAERKQPVINDIANKFFVDEIVDLTHYENENIFLEGTGSMVLDRQNRIAYACISARTNKQLLNTWCKKMNYTCCYFNATDENGFEIYHTNVMMCVAENYVVICLQSIADAQDKLKVLDSIAKTKKQIIEISYRQMNCFAGNMLQVKNTNGDNRLIMSSQAYASLTANQIDQLNGFNTIINSDIKTIETNGGGSARCMIAEIFLKQRF